MPLANQMSRVSILSKTLGYGDEFGRHAGGFHWGYYPLKTGSTLLVYLKIKIKIVLETLQGLQAH